MIALLVVDADTERRATVVDMLCELPGIEVRASAPDASTALGIVDSTQIDAIVAANDLPGSSIVTLIDCGRRRGLSDIIVLVTVRPLLPGMDEYWRDLGARHVAYTIPALVARVRELDVERTRDEQRRRALALQVEAAAALDRSPLSAYARSSLGELVEHTAPRTRVAHAVAPATTLLPVIARLGEVVPPEVELHFEVGIDAPRVRCSAEDLQQLAVLLVRDACAALPLGGKLWLIVEREGPRHVAIEVLESSGRSRTPGRDLDVIRATAMRHGGDVRIVDLGGATSVQVILPAALDVPN